MNKRKGLAVNSNNFRPSTGFSSREEGKGTKPLSDPISVKGALLSMLIHGCRKILFFNTHIKVAIYIGVIFVSFAFDYAPFPRSYFSRSSNMLNQYFVKLGWMWTLLCTVPFVFLTSITYCCGDKTLLRRHLARIGVATALWFCVTKSFVYYENNYGKCSVKGFSSKQDCLKGGYFWHSLDVSGHAFILIYSSLIMIEEARAIIGWESIEYFIRDEAYHRSISREQNMSSPLKNLSYEQLVYLNNAYLKYTPYIKALFVGMTLLTCLWDLMVLSTALYFHKMIEKLLGGIFAVAAWFLTYHYWYPTTSILPVSPRIGVFKYDIKTKPLHEKPNLRRSHTDNIFKKMWPTNGQSNQFGYDKKNENGPVSDNKQALNLSNRSVAMTN